MPLTVVEFGNFSNLESEKFLQDYEGNAQDVSAFYTCVCTRVCFEIGKPKKSRNNLATFHVNISGSTHAIYLWNLRIPS